MSQTTPLDSGVVFSVGGWFDVYCINESGYDYSTFANNKDGFYVAFPWLHSARIEDFINIQQKYVIEFRNFTNKVVELAKKSSEIQSLNDDIRYEVVKCFDELYISFDKAKFDLKTKGVVASLGLALTFIPVAIPNIDQYIDFSSIKSIIGGSTILSSANIIGDLLKLKTNSNEKPFWVLWEWMKRTSHK